MSQDTPDHPSSCASCSDEIAALKSRMNELEHNNANLAERAASAETSLGGATVRMADANKYAAECEAKMKAATARAQARYTEKLHANNESRNLQKQVDQQKFDLHDYHVKTDNYFNTLKVQIKKLEAENNEAGKSALEVQTELESLRNKLTAALEENQRQKAEWNNSKEQIKAVVMKMSSDLNAERAKVAASDEDIAARIDASKNEATREATVKYQSEVKDMEARFEARLAEVMHKSQEDLKVAAADSLSKEQRMLDCNGKLKQQLDDARKQLGLRSRQLQAALQSLQSMRDNQQNLPGSQQGQQSSPQQAPNTNKRRRVDSIGTGSFPTPDSQRARTRSLLSNNDSIFETPHAKSNSNIAMQGQQYRMSPHGANISSGSPAPMASVRPFQQDYKATFMGSPLGNNIGSTQQVQPMQQPMYMGNLLPLDQGQSLQNSNMGKMSTSFLHQSQFSQSSHMGNMYNMGNMGTMGHMGNMQSLAFPPVPANLVLSSMVDEHPDQPAFQPQTQNAMGMDSSPWPMPQPMMGNSPHVFPSNGADMMNTTAYSSQEMMGGSQLAVSESPAPTLQRTTSVCSTPAPRSATSASVRISRATTRRGRTGGPQKVPCVNCYKNWWEDSCDAGETCVNCALENTDCIRQRCFYFSTGCSKRQCPTVHEGDTRYTDDRFLVDQNKAGKRPGRVGKSTDALTAPTLRGKQGHDGVVN